MVRFKKAFQFVLSPNTQIKNYFKIKQRTRTIANMLLAVRFYIYYNIRFSFCTVLKLETQIKIQYYVFKTHKISE